MSNHIQELKIDLWASLFKQEVVFNEGLNLVSGTNGTGKTSLLSHIYDNRNNNGIVVFSEASSEKNITFFSPKRNAEKQLVEQVQSHIGLSKKQKRQLIANIQQRTNTPFQAINSIAYYLQNESQLLVDTSGKTRAEATGIVKDEYQTIFNKIFDYELIYSWDSVAAKPEAKILKNGGELSLFNLSEGENAILSLVCAIYFSKDDTDVYLIDEPEVHLNWSLEEKLFSFLDWFCRENKKQIIAATHSRIIALSEFRTKTNFLFWEEDKIAVSNSFTPSMIGDIAGDTIKIIQGITTKNKLVYIEDESQKTIIDEIAKILKLDIGIQTVAGGCEYVKSFCKSFKSFPAPINNVYFLIDGDNKPLSVEDRAEYKNLIQLNKYCIENYLLDKAALSLLEAIDWDQKVKEIINSIDVHAEPSIKPVQVALDKGATLAELIDYIDGSKIFDKLAISKKGDKKKKYELMREIIQKIPPTDLLGKYFVELSFLED